MKDIKIEGNVLTVKLDQITPILHFQYEQYGATLRASEVKPKLDKFLLSKVSENSASNQWMIDPEHNGAFNYKLSIENIGKRRDWNNIKLIPNNNSKLLNLQPFFGNMGYKNSSHGKELIYYPNGLELHFFSLDKTLLKFVAENICEFFALHNFGTRQSKGFGSYYISPFDPLYQDISEFVRNNMILSYFTVKNTNQLFPNIDLFYKSIRSGAFPYEPDETCASAMYVYLKNELKEKWDRTLFRDVIDRKLTENEAAQNSLYRDVLGLASWTTYGQRKGIISKVVNSSGSEKIQRFKSPIFIKPVYLQDNSEANNLDKRQYKVYFGHLTLPDYENIIDKKATVTGEKIRVLPRGTDHIRSSFKIKMLTIGRGFCLTDYVKYLLTEFNIADCLPSVDLGIFNSEVSQEKGQKQEIAANCDALKEIYKELQLNYKKTCQHI